MRKFGPKDKITAENEKELFACLKVGVPIAVACHCIRINPATFYRKRLKDPEFATRANEAIASGTKHHINKIFQADSWQASAWFLERRHGKYFGKKEVIEHTGKNGGPIETSTKQKFDYESFAKAFEQFVSQSNGRLSRSNGIDKSVHSADPHN